MQQPMPDCTQAGCLNKMTTEDDVMNFPSGSWKLCLLYSVSESRCKENKPHEYMPLNKNTKNYIEMAIKHTAFDIKIMTVKQLYLNCLNVKN